MFRGNIIRCRGQGTVKVVESGRSPAVDSRREVQDALPHVFCGSKAYAFWSGRMYLAEVRPMHTGPVLIACILRGILHGTGNHNVTVCSGALNRLTIRMLLPCRCKDNVL